MAFVPDASVAAAWVLPDEEAALADLALDRLGAETAKAPGVFWHELRNLLLTAGSTSGQQLVDAVAGVVGDPVEHLGESSLGVEAVHLGGFDEGIGDGVRIPAQSGQ